MNKCKKCGAELPNIQNLKFCPSCGNPLTGACNFNDIEKMTVEQLSDKAKELCDKKEFEQALPYLKKAGELGDNYSLLQLGLCLYPLSNRLPHNQCDREKAKECFIEAIRRKDLLGIDALIAICKDGSDKAEAVLDLCGKISNSENEDAELNALSKAFLGFLFIPDESDEEKAAVVKAKEQGCPIDDFCDSQMQKAIDFLIEAINLLPPENDLRKKIEIEIFNRFKDRAASQLIYPKLIENKSKESVFYTSLYLQLKTGSISKQDVHGSIHVLWELLDNIGWQDDLKNAYLLAVSDIEYGNKEGKELLRRLLNCGDYEISGKASAKLKSLYIIECPECGKEFDVDEHKVCPNCGCSCEQIGSELVKKALGQLNKCTTVTLSSAEPICHLLLQASKLGNSEANLQLGLTFYKNLPEAQRDKEFALEFFEKAALQGNLDACVEIGRYISSENENEKWAHAYSMVNMDISLLAHKLTGQFILEEVECALNCLSMDLLFFYQIKGYEGRIDMSDTLQKTIKDINILKPENEFRKAIEYKLVQNAGLSGFSIAKALIEDGGSLNPDIFEFCILRCCDSSGLFNLDAAYFIWESYSRLGWNDKLSRYYIQSLNYVTSDYPNGEHFQSAMSECSDDTIRTATLNKINGAKFQRKAIIGIVSFAALIVLAMAFFFSRNSNAEDMPMDIDTIATPPVDTIASVSPQDDVQEASESDISNYVDELKLSQAGVLGLTLGMPKESIENMSDFTKEDEYSFQSNRDILGYNAKISVSFGSEYLPSEYAICISVDWNLAGLSHDEIINICQSIASHVSSNFNTKSEDKITESCYEFNLRNGNIVIFRLDDSLLQYSIQVKR